MLRDRARIAAWEVRVVPVGVGVDEIHFRLRERAEGAEGDGAGDGGFHAKVFFQIVAHRGEHVVDEGREHRRNL